LFDLCGDVRVGDRPQGRHRLDRGEGQVMARHGLGARPRLLGYGGGELASIDWIAAILSFEEFLRHLRAHLRPNCSGNTIAPNCLAAGSCAAILFATSTRNGLTSPT
jgi:hypothetical protein